MLLTYKSCFSVNFQIYHLFVACENMPLIHTHRLMIDFSQMKDQNKINLTFRLTRCATTITALHYLLLAFDTECKAIGNILHRIQYINRRPFWMIIIYIGLLTKMNEAIPLLSYVCYTHKHFVWFGFI